MVKPELRGIPAALLHYFRRHTGRVISREELGQQVWHLKFHTKSRAVDMTVCTLRKSLAENESILTINGHGYRHDCSPRGG